MSEVKKIATRESYGNALAELGKEFDNLVVLDADLAAATKTGIFKKAFPEAIISSAMLLSRGVNFYLLIIVSVIVVIVNTFREKKVAKQ